MKDLTLQGYRLRFNAPVHFGTGSPEVGQTDPFLRSDTLAGAVAAMWNHLHDDDPGQLLEAGRFLVSSAFPYAGEELYLPRPMGVHQELEYETATRLSDVRFVGKKVFEAVCRGEAVEWELEKVGGAFYPAPEKGSPWREAERPRVAIDRLDSRSQIFYSTAVTFRPGCGLFFLADFGEDGGLKQEFEGVLSLLADRGIGGLRSYGYGTFEFEGFEFSARQMEEAGFGVALSLISPSSREVENGLLTGAAYGMESRGGYLFSGRPRPYRRRQVRMLTEGSVLCTDALTAGQARDVTPRHLPDGADLRHRVLRQGRGLLLPLKRGE